MRVIQLVNSRPARTGRKLLVDWGDGRGAVVEGIPDEVANGDVARCLADKAKRMPKAWRAIEERKIDARPTMGM